MLKIASSAIRLPLPEFHHLSVRSSVFSCTVRLSDWHTAPSLDFPHASLLCVSYWRAGCGMFPIVPGKAPQGARVDTAPVKATSKLPEPLCWLCHSLCLGVGPDQELSGWGLAVLICRISAAGRTRRSLSLDALTCGPA